MQTKTKNNHIGRKISRIRELRGMKQETLAEELGISQQAVSNIENSEKVDDVKLEEIAWILRFVLCHPFRSYSARHFGLICATSGVRPDSFRFVLCQ